MMMMMMMDQTRVVLYQYIHYEHVSTLHQNERGRLRGVVGIRSGNRSHSPSFVPHGLERE